MVQIHDLIITRVSVFVNKPANSHIDNSKKRHELTMKLKKVGCDIDKTSQHRIEAGAEERNR